MLTLCHEYTGCHASVDVVSRLWVGWFGPRFPAEQEIYSSPERPWAPPSLLYTEYRRLLLKRPEHETDHSSLSSVKAENEYTPPPLYPFTLCVPVGIKSCGFWGLRGVKGISLFFVLKGEKGSPPPPPQYAFTVCTSVRITCSV